MIKEWDIFISYAAEDKEIVLELYSLLQKQNLKVWLDKEELKIGDSVTKNINEGLLNSKYFISFISPNYLNKKWTQLELNAGIGLENSIGEMIIPIWHNVSYEYVLKKNPLVADRYALKTKDGIDNICEAIVSHINEESISKYQKTILLPYYLDRVFKSLLTKMQYNVLWANNRDDIIKLGVNNNFDIALEWQHGINDYPIRDILNFINKDVPIMLCLNWNGNVIENYKANGYVDCLSIPWNIEEFREKIKKYTKNK